jgi:predicted SAM-dependent methyltransferase
VQRKQQLLDVLGLGNLAHPYVVHAHRLRRNILRSDVRLRYNYLHNNAEPKLHVGGGWHRLDGWLNTDIELIPDVMRMDATERFPFQDGAFQYVYTEHMIEHIPYQQGSHMLRECHRVLRKGGLIRVTTPDLAAVTGLCNCDLSSEQREYLLWFCQTFVPQECPRNAASAINAMFSNWGHRFIYDEDTLAEVMRAAGFSSIKRWSLGDSADPQLQKLENEQRYPAGLLDFESLALEGRKEDLTAIQGDSRCSSNLRTR